MAADALVPCVARTSAAMFITVIGKQEEFPLLVASKVWELIENAKNYWCGVVLKAEDKIWNIPTQEISVCNNNVRSWLEYTHASCDDALELDGH